MMPTIYFCKRYSQILKPVANNRGYEHFLTPDGKMHQCMKYNKRKPWKCNKLELRGTPI
jgi:hypothetical protein